MIVVNKSMHAAKEVMKNDRVYAIRRKRQRKRKEYRVPYRRPYLGYGGFEKSDIAGSRLRQIP